MPPQQFMAYTYVNIGGHEQLQPNIIHRQNKRILGNKKLLYNGYYSVLSDIGD